MKRFFLKVFLVFIPALLIYSFPLFVMVASGELTPIPLVIRAQRSDERMALYGPAYSNVSMHFKLQSVIDRKPQVMVLGTSRSMQFRSAFFKEDVVFYNASGGVEKIQDFERFLEEIPEVGEPEIIIIGLDHYFFNANWDEALIDDSAERIALELDPLESLTANWRRAYQDYRRKKVVIPQLLNRSRDNVLLVGLNAIKFGNGFRNDGSYYYGRYIANPDDPTYPDFEFRDTFERIAEGKIRFEYGQELNPRAVESLSRFLEACQQRGIYVVGYLPPYAHVVYQKMVSMPHEYAYLFEIQPTLKPLFDQYGYSFFDFSDLAWVGAPDSQTIDGFHGSENAYLRLFIEMTRMDARLLTVSVEENTLLERLQNAPNDYVVFGNQEY